MMLVFHVYSASALPQFSVCCNCVSSVVNVCRGYKVEYLQKALQACVLPGLALQLSGWNNSPERFERLQ